jgi:hypothetical protein
MVQTERSKISLTRRGNLRALPLSCGESDQTPSTGGLCLGYIGWLTTALMTLCDLYSSLTRSGWIGRRVAQ